MTLLLGAFLCHEFLNQFKDSNYCNDTWCRLICFSFKMGFYRKELL